MPSFVLGNTIPNLETLISNPIKRLLTDDEESVKTDRSTVFSVLPHTARHPLSDFSLDIPLLRSPRQMKRYSYWNSVSLVVLE